MTVQAKETAMATNANVKTASAWRGRALLALALLATTVAATGCVSLELLGVQRAGNADRLKLFAVGGSENRSVLSFFDADIPQSFTTVLELWSWRVPPYPLAPSVDLPAATAGSGENKAKTPARY
jgi:hypothetical protein